MDTNNNIKIGIYTDAAQSIHAFKKANESLDSFINKLTKASSPKITKGFTMMDKALASNKKWLDVTSKSAQIYGKSLEKINRLGVKSLFGKSTTAPTPGFMGNGMTGKEMLQTERLNRLRQGTVGWINRGKEAQMGFNGAALSGMFFGMALQRVFQGALKGIFEGYKKIIPEGSSFNKLTTQLSANWEFFKFQLADALANSPLFVKFIGFLINTLKALQKLSPATKAFLGYVIIVGAALGSWLVTVNILKLGLAGLLDGMMLIDGETKKFKWGALSKYGWMALAAAGIYGIYEALNSFYKSSEQGIQASKDMKKGWLDTLNSALIPLGEGLAGVSIKLNNWNEYLIVAGVIIHNSIVLIGVLADVFVLITRVIFNVITIINPLIVTLRALSKTMMHVLKGEWAEAWASAQDTTSNVVKNMKQDINDITNSIDTFATNFEQKTGSLQGITPALDNYRTELELASVSSKKENTGNTTNIIIATPSEALGQGLINNETYEMLIEAGFYNQKINVNGFVNN